MTDPYNYNDPITDTDDFIGRAAIINKIFSRIGAGRPQSVSIVGEYKIGKTSLLNYIINNDIQRKYFSNPENYCCLLLPVKQCTGSLKDFVNKLCMLVSQGTSIPCTPGTIAENYDWFKHTVESITKQNKKLILFFDDFNLITQNTEFPLEFFSFMRSLANNFNVAYVTTSYLDLQQLCSSKDIEESPFFNIFTNVTLRAFDPKDFDCFIEQIGGNGVLKSEDYKHLLSEMTGNFPFLLQIGKSVLSKITGINKELTEIEKILAQGVLVKAKDYFNYIWSNLSQDQQTILQYIACSRKIKSSQQYIVNELLYKQLLVENRDGFSIFSRTFKKYIMEKCDIKVPLIVRLKRLLGF